VRSLSPMLYSRLGRERERRAREFSCQKTEKYPC